MNYNKMNNKMRKNKTLKLSRKKHLHLCTFFQKTTNIYKHDSDDIKNQ